MPETEAHKGLFYRLIELGIRPEMDFSARRSVRIINFIAMVGAGMSANFAVIELLLFLFDTGKIAVALWANIVLVVLLVVVPLLNIHKGNLFAGLYLMSVAYIQIIVFSLFSSSQLGVHFWLFLACAGSFLVFDKITNKQRSALVLVSIALFFAVEFACTQERAWYPLAPNILLFSRWLNLGILFLALVGIINIFRRQSQKAQLLLERELKKSEGLLLDVLPPSIASRLKSGERTIAELFSDVTVVFADIVGFTALAASLPPDKVVWLLDTIFSTFDEITHKYKLEKIKTIGDCYMAVGGLPEPMPDHAEAVARAALEMDYELSQISLLTGFMLDIRIGIHTGTVIAGVIGTKKITYDIWGDTVNVASRMESHGEAGKIHCSEEVFQQLRHVFTFEERGIIEVKGKGAMKTYFLGRQ